ncbi:MAG: hydrolase [Candidatus Nezhaarchaeota archaeon]|nr:hydrolase [Candidatus Nezhaarchaeota archaeon]
MVLCFRLTYPLHGCLHTFLVAILVGLAFGCVMYLLERFLRSLYKAFLLETDKGLSVKSFAVAGFSGAGLHVLLDAPLYDDIAPFYPITANPLYNPSLMPEIYSLCAWMGVFGIMYYIGLLGLALHRKLTKRNSV